MYQFGRFRFDPENHLLQRDGEPVSLSPKAFEILLLLVQNGNGLTTKEEVMRKVRKVWRDSFVEEANLTVTISALRKQLGLDENGRQYIETVPKKGYRFAIPVRQVTDRDGATIEGRYAAAVEPEGNAPEQIPVLYSPSERGKGSNLRRLPENGAGWDFDCRHSTRRRGIDLRNLLFAPPKA